MTDSTSWKPRSGDKITLTLVDFGEHNAGWGPYPILEGEDDAGKTFAVHAFHDVLRAELGRLAPQLGDRITITYNGKHPAKGYHQYRVRFADGRGAHLDWSKYGSVEAPDTPQDTSHGQPTAVLPHIGDDDIPF